MICLEFFNACVGVLNSDVRKCSTDWHIIICFSAEHNYVLPPVEQMKLAEATTEEVAMETRTTYGLTARNQLQTEQVLVETNVAYGMRSEQEAPAEQVTELAYPLNSESQI